MRRYSDAVVQPRAHLRRSCRSISAKITEMFVKAHFSADFHEKPSIFAKIAKILASARFLVDFRENAAATKLLQQRYNAAPCAPTLPPLLPLRENRQNTR